MVKLRTYIGMLAIVGILLIVVAAPVAWAQGGPPAGDRPGHPAEQPGRPGDPLHDVVNPEVIKGVIADTLGLTVGELDAAHEAGTTLEELAATQGVTIEEVQAAAKASAIAQVNQAVTDGKITQEQADQIIEHINNSDFPLGGPEHPGHPGGPAEGLRGIVDPDVIKGVIADTLGLTVEELDAAHDAGTTLEELAATQGVTIEEVQAAAKASAIAQVNQAVTDGKLTQEQADQIIEHINNSDFPLHGPGPRPHAPANPADTTTTTDTNAEAAPSTVTAQNAAVMTTALYLPFVIQ
ncbi:MAG: hypothetical protein R3C14_30865 [Caldilineaceae bacterium]